jgi:hypothetical protein
VTATLPEKKPRSHPEQLEFLSLAFPKDRKVLSVKEVAAVWDVSENHVINLLEEGKLAGFDVAGRVEYIRVPIDALAALAAHFGVQEAQIREVIAKVCPPKSNARSRWRVPVESYKRFMSENHSEA